MNWASPQDFFYMGGYGLYVWGSYAIVAACMVFEPWLAARRHRAALQALQESAQESAQGGAS